LFVNISDKVNFWSIINKQIASWYFQSDICLIWSIKYDVRVAFGYAVAEFNKTIPLTNDEYVEAISKATIAPDDSPTIMISRICNLVKYSEVVDVISDMSGFAPWLPPHI